MPRLQTVQCLFSICEDYADSGDYYFKKETMKEMIILLEGNPKTILKTQCKIQIVC